MVDVGLESTIADDSEPPPDLITMQLPDEEPDRSRRPFYKSRGGDRMGDEINTPTHALSTRHQGQTISAVDSELGLRPPSTNDADASTTVATAPLASDGEMFKHDTFFAWLYLIAQASLLSTFVLIFLHTSGKRPRGDTIYTTLRASFHMLAVDTLVSIIVSLVWLAALRSFVRPLVLLIMLAVPVILTSFALYPFVSSYQSTSGSTRLQDLAMRWAALIPAVSAVVWVYMVLKGRHALHSAIEILDFSSRILAANSALLLVGMGCLAVVVLWTWVWLLMFTRVFLGGSFSNPLSRFVISVSTWWLGAYFVLMYIWTLSVIAGVQRGTTAAAVSQWYFHRNAVPAPSSQEVVQAALSHALTTIFGTVSLSTLMALGIRLPLLVLPQRLAGVISMFAYSFVPTPIAAMTNPLTLTYAAIHSQNLGASARGLSQMDFLGPQSPTTTLTPAALQPRNGSNLRSSSPLLPYRLAKLILHATRFVMATALGFAGWVITARQLTLNAPDGSSGGGMGSSLRGSAYAYVVGLVASFIGWGILGAMEGVLSGIVDAVVICYGSEKRMLVGEHGGYCMEAAMLFGGAAAGGYGRDGRQDREESY